MNFSLPHFHISIVIKNIKNIYTESKPYFVKGLQLLTDVYSQEYSKINKSEIIYI